MLNIQILNIIQATVVLSDTEHLLIQILLMVELLQMVFMEV